MDLESRDDIHSASIYAEMRALLRQSCAARKIPQPLRLSRLEAWYYAPQALEPPEYFNSRAHLWRAPDGRLAAFCLRADATVHCVVDPALPNGPSIEEELLDWVEANWSGPHPVECEARAYELDLEQRRLFAQRGYLDAGYASTLRIYDLNRPYAAAALPSRFRFATLAETGAREERIALEQAVWTHERPAPSQAWFRGKTASPFYSFDWDLLAISSQGELAAFILVWVDWQNHCAEIDPMGTHPDYRHQGIARAVVIEAFQRLASAGITRLYIESDADPDAPANRLYASLDPVQTHIARRWIKRL